MFQHSYPTFACSDIVYAPTFFFSSFSFSSSCLSCLFLSLVREERSLLMPLLFVRYSRCSMRECDFARRPTTCQHNVRAPPPRSSVAIRRLRLGARTLPPRDRARAQGFDLSRLKIRDLLPATSINRSSKGRYSSCLHAWIYHYHYYITRIITIIIIIIAIIVIILLSAMRRRRRGQWLGASSASVKDIIIFLLLLFLVLFCLFAKSKEYRIMKSLFMRH